MMLLEGEGEEEGDEDDDDDDLLMSARARDDKSQCRALAMELMLTAAVYEQRRTFICVQQSKQNTNR
jgi:hypothetical protein